MQKFSKIEQNIAENNIDTTVFKSDRFKIVKQDGWEFNDQPEDYVVAIVYLSNHMELIFRLEPVPSYKSREKDFDRFLTVLSGTRTFSEEIEECLFREIYEETGLVISKAYTSHQFLQSLFVSKAGTPKYHIYWVPLLDSEYRLEKAPGDGSIHEANSTSFRINISQINSLKPVDTITSLCIQLAKKELGIKN
jgi:8-oxo-dGTP pyrophosphatase MutT (NUDIX family)